MYKMELTREELAFLVQLLGKVSVDLVGARSLVSVFDKIDSIIGAKVIGEKVIGGKDEKPTR